MVKIYKYRDMLYRVELLITFALKYNNVTHLVFLLGALISFFQCTWHMDVIKGSFCMLLSFL